MVEIQHEKGLVRGLEKRTACDLCHIKKIKCDAKKPVCSHCVVYGKQCTYSPHIKRRRREIKVQTNHAISKAAAPPVRPSKAPPLQDLLPRLEDYFLNLNSVVPLFDRNSFIHMVEGTQYPPPADSLITAAINVVLALTYQNRSTSLSPIPSFDPETCIANTLGATNTLEGCYHSLLGLQILLGFIFYTTGIPREGGAAAIGNYVASAVKLSHRLSLHSSRTNARFDPDVALQRTRVFWIVYIVDRQMGMYTHSPPLLQDSDHDIAVPTSTPGYGLVRFVTEDRQTVDIDFLHARIQLARIQGTIYTQLYSVSASSQPHIITQHRTKQICATLAEWLAAMIPPELHLDRLEGLSPRSSVRQLISMYLDYIACFKHTHKVGHQSAEWIARLVNYSQEIVFGSLGTSSAELSFIRPSEGWEPLVSTARECAQLFRMIDRDDVALMWTATCTYISAALVLVANNLTVSSSDRQGDDIDAEEKLIAEAVDYLSRGVTSMPHSANVQKMATAFAELSCRARIARARFALLGSGGAGLQAGNNTSASVAWLEAEARRSASHSARELVQAFTVAEQKSMDTRLSAGMPCLV